MADMLSNISFIFFMLTGGFLLLTIILWFLLKIPFVVGDLSGKSAKRSIERSRRINEQNGAKYYRSSTVNIHRGKLTETMRTEKMKKAKIEAGKNNKIRKNPETGMIKENQAAVHKSEETELLHDSAETELLHETKQTELLHNSKETELLHDSKQTELRHNTQETEILYESGETAFLENDTVPLENTAWNETTCQSDKNVIKMIDDIMIIHTNEVI